MGKNNPHIVKISNFQYVLTSFLYLLFLIAFVVYVTYKGYIISINFEDTLRHPWLIVIFSCEVLYCLSSFLTAVEVWIPPSNRPVKKLMNFQNVPNVDIFITTCNEEIDAILDTLLSVLNLNYPREKYMIYVLDDGGDEELMGIVEEFKSEQHVTNLIYLRREKVPGKPHHFKAGNINYGLQYSDGEYIAIIDADMILHRDFLNYTLPHIMFSSEVAFLQTPQSFYNIRPGDPLSDSQYMWYANILLHRDTLHCASCCGTGAIFRRTQLEEIGGFQTKSITEDVLTSTMLFSKGYRSVYVNYKLQMGLAPWTYRGYLKQRDRWGRGAIQLITSTLFQVVLNPYAKMSFYKRVLHFWYFASYLMYLINVVIVSTMILLIYFDWKSYPGTDIEGRRLLFFLAPVIVFWRTYWILAWRHVPNATQQKNRDEASFWYQTPYMVSMIISSIFTPCFGGLKFISTGSVDKSKNDYNFALNLWSVKSQIIYIGLVAYVVTWRSMHLDRTNCKDVIFVIGISIFLGLIALYMAVPIVVALTPNTYSPSDRRYLLRYDKNGNPIFDVESTIPELAWHTYLYELITISIPILWITYFVMLIFNYDVQLCEKIRYGF